MTRNINITRQPDCNRSYNKKTHVERAGVYKPWVGGFTSAAFSPDSKTIYTNSGVQFATFDRDSGKKLMDYKANKTVRDPIWISPDNQYIVATVNSSTGPNAECFRVGNPTPIAAFMLPSVANMASPGRSVDVTNVLDLNLRCAKADPVFGSADAGKEPPKVSPNVPAITAIEKYKLAVSSTPNPGFTGSAFSANGKYLLVATTEKKVAVYETATGKLVKSFPTNFNTFYGVAMAADDTIFISGGSGKLLPPGVTDPSRYIAKIALATGKEERMPAVASVVTKLQLSPDCTRLYGIGLDFSLRVWDVKNGNVLHAWENLPRVPRSFQISPDGKLGLIVLDNGPIVVHLDNFRDGLKIPEAATIMYMIGDGSRAAMVSKDVTLKIWNLKTGNVDKSVDLAERDSTKKFTVAPGTPDGKHVNILGKLDVDDLYHVLEIDSGRILYRYQLSGPRGQRVASYGNLIVYRSVGELRVVEMPPLPKK